MGVRLWLIYGSRLVSASLVFVFLFQPVGFWGLVATLLAEISVSSPWAEVEIVYAAGFLGWASSCFNVLEFKTYIYPSFMERIQ